ncbi:hypothetical protein [Massilia sp. Leaf139]|uniref:hypothetical protein n=1 Tax=Massilia sp. Leaf139 TaxID=1736272 RepID=UPI0006FCB78D|nr:hypothetical protein [Massilia sp. Leaf139]KQQ97433.1 hypothetical protein ASF77_05680 [Massilia sp. Leaf139]
MAAPHKDEAVVVKLKGRYFYGFGRKGQVLTAWSLVGARLFRAGACDLREVVGKLVAKRRSFEVMVIAEVA